MSLLKKFKKTNNNLIIGLYENLNTIYVSYIHQKKTDIQLKNFNIIKSDNVLDQIKNKINHQLIENINNYKLYFIIALPLNLMWSKSFYVKNKLFGNSIHEYVIKLLNQQLPLDNSELYFDYKHNDLGEINNTKISLINIVACQKTLLDKYLEEQFNSLNIFTITTIPHNLFNYLITTFKVNKIKQTIFIYHEMNNCIFFKNTKFRTKMALFF